MSGKGAGSASAPASASGVHRCGVVALLGRPNAGKSTLLNALLGEKLAITAARAQTTRGRILGVRTLPGVQMIFHDTPGVHRGQARFNLAMTETALRSAEDADLRLLLLEARASWDAPEARLVEQFAADDAPVFLVRTKCDLAEPGPVPEAQQFAGVHCVAATRGSGVESLLAALARSLPVGPALYPEDTLTDAPLRFLAAEQIREVVFERYRDEIPYAIAVEVDRWEERDGDVRIAAQLLVERESQKGIVVGAGGRMLKAVGSEARRRLGEWLGKTVHLNLWVKTDRNWTKRPRRLRELGYL